MREINNDGNMPIILSSRDIPHTPKCCNIILKHLSLQTYFSSIKIQFACKSFLSVSMLVGCVQLKSAD